MNILMVGGTRFLGKALVEAALKQGFRITLFNRGQTNPDWFPEVEKIRGDRNHDLSALENRSWDAVIDTCAYFPRQVRTLLAGLGNAIGHYTLISSISVYADFSQPGLVEDSPLAVLADPEVEQITNDTYGGLKVLCEQFAEATLPNKVLTIRPGLIVGPFDLSDRFTYWPARVAKGGEILCPDSPDWYTQVIDVRDLAGWTLDLATAGVTGIFNATGPDYRLTFGDVLETSRKVSGSDAWYTWASTDFLLENGVEPWSQLPLWLPGPENAGADQVNIAKSLAHGLSFRPLEQTVRDTLAWEASRPQDHPWRAGLDPDRERELLQKLHSTRNP
jgi:2'-hydroxyisoflavone reductase